MEGALLKMKSIFRMTTPTSLSRNMPSFSQVLKSTCFCLCLGVLLDRSWKCYARYQLKETSVTLDVVSSKDVSFPSFSLCPPFERSYNVTFLAKYGLTPSHYRHGIYPQPIPGMDLRTFHDMATFELAMLMDKIEVKTTEDVHVFGPEHDSWIVYPSFMHGRCFNLDLPASVHSLAVKEVIFYLQDSHVDSKSMIQAPMSQHMFIDFSYEITWLKENQVKTAQAEFERFGCVDQTLPRVHYPVCDTSSFNASRQQELFEFQKNVRFNANSACPSPCVNMASVMSLPIYGQYETNKSYVKLYASEHVKLWRFTENYQFLSMVAEIGGYTGLLLGLSCYQLNEVVLSLATSVWRLWLNNRRPCP